MASPRKRPKTITTPPRTASGIIRSEWAYRIPAFCQELGITRQRLSDMRERGLKIREDGKYRIVLGSDYLDWLKTLPYSQAQYFPEDEKNGGSPD